MEAIARAMEGANKGHQIKACSRSRIEIELMKKILHRIKRSLILCLFVLLREIINTNQ